MAIALWNHHEPHPRSLCGLRSELLASTFAREKLKIDDLCRRFEVGFGAVREAYRASHRRGLSSANAARLPCRARYRSMPFAISPTFDAA